MVTRNFFNCNAKIKNIIKRPVWAKDENRYCYKMDKKMDKLLENNKKIENRLTRVEENVLENEADRIRAELFDCGNRCRREIRLHPEEMDHIRAIYHKYKDILHQNHEGDVEFDFILNYYNHQDFPSYHKQIDTTK